MLDRPIRQIALLGADHWLGDHDSRLEKTPHPLSWGGKGTHIVGVPNLS